MFRRILIANRGEIACRVIRTARSLGVSTVAVYSDADAEAFHVRAADEAVRVGSAPARDSYLVVASILEAARRTGSEAIHPGYGFLSESEEFARACQDAGIVFIGPTPEAIRAMGSKSAAKALMERAGVPLAPGYHGDRQDAAYLAQQAEAIGYPVLIKASAGGGGKGMRRVDHPSQFTAALDSCRREAGQAFGDERVLVEKYLLRPRHIEIQVFGDSHGSCLHLFERDCSVQRRHQKVVEEAPAPGLTPERREAMGLAAVEAARAVGYVGAGTVEFIVDQDGRFYFMEMNTRLQVEHPVTENITGVDLVEWQLKVAAGEPLPLTQDQLSINGHSIEARIYAEDPDKGFLPSTGRLVCLIAPGESDHVRVDSGVEQGDEITAYYDPMIAKLIVWGHDRHQALGRMRQALAQYRIVGVSNNVDFLSRLVAVPSFAEGRLDTALIEREEALLFQQHSEAPVEVWLLAALAELLRERIGTEPGVGSAARPCSPWSMRDGWRLNGSAERALSFRHAMTVRRVTTRAAGESYWMALDGQPLLVRGSLVRDGGIHAQLGERRVRAAVVVSGERRQVFYDGRCWPLSLVDTVNVGGEGEPCEDSLRAPMPGRVVSLAVEPGAVVEKGAGLMVLEAMKMEHTVVAPRAGRVRRFLFGVGDQVSDGVELLEFEGLH